MYHLYILLCSDASLYTGITTDLKRRIGEHNGEGAPRAGRGRGKSSNLGAKYTRARRPVRLVYSKRFKNRSTASKAEARVKKLSHDEKLDLIR